MQEQQKSCFQDKIFTQSLLLKPQCIVNKKVEEIEPRGDAEADFQTDSHQSDVQSDGNGVLERRGETSV